MSKNNVVDLAGREKIRDELTDLIREGVKFVNGEEINQPNQVAA